LWSQLKLFLIRERHPQVSAAMQPFRHSGVFDSTPIVRKESPNYPSRELEAICFPRSMEVLAEEWNFEPPARQMTNLRA